MNGINLRFEVFNEMNIRVRKLVEAMVEDELENQEKINTQRSIDLLKDVVQERFQNLNFLGIGVTSSMWMMKWEVGNDGKRIVVYGHKPHEQMQTILVRYVLGPQSNFKSKVLDIDYPIDDDGIAMIVGVMEQLIHQYQ